RFRPGPGALFRPDVEFLILLSLALLQVRGFDYWRLVVIQLFPDLLFPALRSQPRAAAMFRFAGRARCWLTVEIPSGIPRGPGLRRPAVVAPLRLFPTPRLQPSGVVLLRLHVWF